MFLTVYLLAALLSLLAVLLLSSWRKSALPGPREFPIIGIIWEFFLIAEKDIMVKLKKLIDRFEGIMEVHMGGHPYVFLTEPETVEQLLSSVTHIKKGIHDYRFMIPFLKDGLVLSEGAKWHNRRKILTPTFHFKILEDAMSILCEHSERFANTLLATGGDPVDVEDIIRSTTHNVICETAMSVKLNTEDKQQNQYVEAIKRLPGRVVERYLKPWLRNDFLYKFTNSGKGFFKDLNTVHSFTRQIIANRQKQFIKDSKSGVKDKSYKNKNFLDSLLELNLSNAKYLSEDDICEEVDTFMFEGHDTTAACLIFTVFLLANHPEEQEKVAEEMTEIFGTDNRQPTMQDLTKMNYLEMVIKESLRLYPSVPFLSRTLTEDLEIAEGVVIPQGHTAAVLTYFLHRSKRHWEEPEEFIPGRFAPGNPRHPFSFIPFSAGPRNCIGQKFAMMELKTTLSTLLRKCRLEAVTTIVSTLPTAILKCHEPVIIKVFRRKP